MISKERWQTFSKHDQLLHLMSALSRAELLQREGGGDNFRRSLEEGFTLLDLMLGDPKWRDSLAILLAFREEMAKFYTGERTDDISVLSQAL